MLIYHNNRPAGGRSSETYSHPIHTIVIMVGWLMDTNIDKWDTGWKKQKNIIRRSGWSIERINKQKNERMDGWMDKEYMEIEL
jgi:hypothetical protein